MSFPDLSLFYMQIYGGFGFSWACSGFLGISSGLPQAGNPPYTISDFLNFYPQFFGAATNIAVALNGTTIFSVGNSAGMAPGQFVQGSGIPNGTILTAVVTAPVDITGDTTEDSLAVANVSDVSELLIGQPISGMGIAPGTFIAGLGMDSLTLSQPAGGTATGVALEAISSAVQISNAATVTGNVTLQVYEAPPIPLVVLQVFLNLAYASLMSSRWRETWPFAMALYIAHFADLYLQAKGNGNTSPGAIAQAGIARGILVSKSADGVSAGFQALTGLEAWGSWNLTLFGQQLITFAQVVGAGPIYVR